MSEQKKVSIFSLYEKEKKITLKDDSGNSLDVLFVKMTQGELADSLKVYSKSLKEFKDGIKNNLDEYEEVKKYIFVLSKKDLVATITSIEKIFRAQISDIYPLEDEKDKTQEQKQKERAEIFSKWESERKEELEKLSEEELKNRLVELQIENISSVRAATTLNNYCLSIMVRDVETREKIFNTPEDVFKLKDKSIYDALIKVLDEFRYNTNDKTIRENAQDPNFTQAGQSQEK